MRIVPPTPNEIRRKRRHREPALPLPHERDEGATSTTAVVGPGPVDPVMAQAHRDIERGLVDTDMRATPGLDAQRRRQLVKGPGGQGPKR